MEAEILQKGNLLKELYIKDCCPVWNVSELLYLYKFLLN